MKTTGLELIANERKEQIEKHGFTVAKDVADYGCPDELVSAANYLLITSSKHDPKVAESFWPDWEKHYRDKFDAKSKAEKLVVAGALIAAAVDVLNAR